MKWRPGSTPTGIRIIKHAGFNEVANLGNGRLAFELDITKTDAKLLREYKEIVNTHTSAASKNKQTKRTTGDKTA